MPIKKIHVILFILTLITTTLAGYEWIYGKSILLEYKTFTFQKFTEGFRFSIPFLMFLTFHEFGHYFMAKFKKIDVTPPYYLPAWFGVMLSIGTFGAFIRIKDQIKTKKDYFDVAVAGPLAGFIVALTCLYIGFSSIKSDDYIFQIHPEYKNIDFRAELNKQESNPNAIILGESLLFKAMKSTISEAKFLPHKYEYSHYPWIFAGFLGLMFTALNLLPIGQLDGGHILFSMIGKRNFDIVSPIFLVLLCFYGGLGLFKTIDIFEINQNTGYEYFFYFLFFIYFNYLTFSKIFISKLNNLILALGVIILQLLLTHFYPGINGYSGILAFTFLLGRFLGVYHPDVEVQEKLDPKRFIIGILAILIFIVCISAQPIN